MVKKQFTGLLFQCDYFLQDRNVSIVWGKATVLVDSIVVVDVKWLWAKRWGDGRQTQFMKRGQNGGVTVVAGGLTSDDWTIILDGGLIQRLQLKSLSFHCAILPALCWDFSLSRDLVGLITVGGLRPCSLHCEHIWSCSSSEVGERSDWSIFR